MINGNEVSETLADRFPGWKVNIRQSGVTLWVNLNDGSSNYFELQVTPKDGVGLSVIENTVSDMSGHDEVFDTFDGAIDYIERVILGRTE